MKHQIRVFGGFDFDIHIRCDCGEHLGHTHDTLTMQELQDLVASYAPPTEEA